MDLSQILMLILGYSQLIITGEAERYIIQLLDGTHTTTHYVGYRSYSLRKWYRPVDRSAPQLLLSFVYKNQSSIPPREEIRIGISPEEAGKWRELRVRQAEKGITLDRTNRSTHMYTIDLKNISRITIGSYGNILLTDTDPQLFTGELPPLPPLPPQPPTPTTYDHLPIFRAATFTLFALLVIFCAALAVVVTLLLHTYRGCPRLNTQADDTDKSTTTTTRNHPLYDDVDHDQQNSSHNAHSHEADDDTYEDFTLYGMTPSRYSANRPGVV